MQFFAEAYVINFVNNSIVLRFNTMLIFNKPQNL